MSQLKARLLCLEERGTLGFKDMFAKMLLAWGMVVFCLTLLGHSQDPLGTEVFNMPSDLRKTSSLNDGDAKVYLDPLADLGRIWMGEGHLSSNYLVELCPAEVLRGVGDPLLQQGATVGAKVLPGPRQEALVDRNHLLIVG
jgi:hypothetical protein